MVFLLGIAVAMVGAALSAVPMAWVLMLAAGNFGHSQYGFIDVFPAACAIMLAFGHAASASDK